MSDQGRGACGLAATPNLPLHVSYMPRPGPISDGFGVEAFGVVDQLQYYIRSQLCAAGGAGQDKDGRWQLAHLQCMSNLLEGEQIYLRSKQGCLQYGVGA